MSVQESRLAGLEPPSHMVDFACEVSGWSPCRSKRGVVIFSGGDVISSGYNYKPRGFACDGSEMCKATCRVEAVHAEQQALLAAGSRAHASEMVHVKTVDGKLVASGGPSCVECSKLIRVAGIAWMWLYTADGWRRYSGEQFHRLSLVARTVERRNAMSEQQITIFMFVPGRDWLMTSASVSSDAELKNTAEEFAKRHGENKWTEMRVYTRQPEWQARGGAVAWNSSGDMSAGRPARAEDAETKEAKVDRLLKAIGENFRTFGGGRDSEWNPMAHALRNAPLQFAAGVDVRAVLEFLEAAEWPETGREKSTLRTKRQIESNS